MREGIIHITREYDGIKFVEGNFSTKEQIEIIRSLQFGTPLCKSFSIRSNSVHETLIQVNVPDNENLYVGFDFNKINLTDAIMNLILLAKKLNYPLQLLSYDSLMQLFKNYGELSIFIFGLLSGKKIRFYGNDSHKIGEIILSILLLFTEYKFEFFICNSYTDQHYSEYRFTGQPNHFLDKIEELNENIVHVDMENKMVIGIEKSDFTDKIANLINQSKFDESLKIIQNLFKLAKEINTTDSVTIAKKLQISLDDADLLLKIKDNLEENMITNAV